jgi:hypothetical protein
MRVEQRRAKVAAMALQGLRPSEIARRLFGADGAAGRVKVSQDLRHLREQWRASALKDIAEAKGRVLAELAEARRAAWKAWRRSRHGGQDGNPKFLGLVYDLLAEEARLYGLTSNAPVFVQGEPPRPGVQMSPEERERAVRAILVAAERQTGRHSEAAQLLALMDGAAPADGSMTVDVATAANGQAVPYNPQESGGGGLDDNGNGEAVPYGLKELPPAEDACDPWADGDSEIKPLFGP